MKNYEDIRILHRKICIDSKVKLPKISPDVDFMHSNICYCALSLMDNKNHDYRSGSGDPFANFRESSQLGVDPVLGILIRMFDKISRIKTFVRKGTLLVKEESVFDNVLDLVNYMVLALSMMIEQNLDVYASNAKGSLPERNFPVPFPGRKEMENRAEMILCSMSDCLVKISQFMLKIPIGYSVYELSSNFINDVVMLNHTVSFIKGDN